MSRIRRKPIAVPANVKVAVNGRLVSVEGPKGKLDVGFRPEISVEHDVAAKMVTVSRASDQRLARAIHGLTRAVLQNNMVGVTQGYEKRLELVGSATSRPCRGRLCNFASAWPMSSRCRSRRG